ncbi:MAG: CcdB family protein [Marinobacter sp.]|uniref:CcdB family protein n=1 Tax=Marinobacter sp. TaxID=50741 RepID=UPI00396E99EE
MAQLDVYPNPSKTSKAHYPYLVDIQSSLLSELATRIVIPLGKRSAFGGGAMQGLTPEISFADQELLLLTPQISLCQKSTSKTRLAPSRISKIRLLELWTWLSLAFNASGNGRQRSAAS